MSIKTNLGTVTAYADAKAHGYTGTKEEFGEVLANFAESATQVADDKKTVEAIKSEITKMQSDVTQKHKEVGENANRAANAASSASSAASSASSSQQAAKQSEQNINNIVSTFDSHVESKTTEIDTAANAAKQKAVSAVEAQANASVQKVKNSTSSYITDQKVTAEKEINNYTSSKITEIDTAANAAKKSLNETITNANTAKSALDASVKTSDTSKTDLDKSIQSSSVKKTELDESITKANQTKTDLDNSTSTSNNALQSLQSENSSAASNIEELKSENFNSQEILSGVADLRAYLGLTADDIVGIQVDYKNKTFKRLAGAANLTPGSDFDKFSMYGGRRKCNVADDGTINAWYGDDNYTEDGSNGQVMVYQPKFYYLTATYEGSLYDTSAAAYLLQDEQLMSSAEDKFSSIAGARPASGSSQNLTRTEIEKMAQNRGTNWHGDLIKPVSAEQLLMIIELGIMNTQTGVGQGVVGLPYTTGDDTTSSYAAATGSTTALGNRTGRAEKTTTYEGGSAKEYTVDGKTSICWRGKENFWGNIWKFVYGISIWGNGKMNGGQPYICSDFNFAENKNSGNYEPAGFTVAPKEGYISAMGYSTKFDWLFIASETLGNSSLPVGDYTYLTQNLNGYRIARLGGYWYNGSDAGAFCWALGNGVGDRSRGIGGRLVYIPDRDSDAYTTAIASWKSQITA